MLKVALEIDVAAFERQVDDHIARTFQPGVVEALNRAGEAGATAVRKGLISAFDRPNPFNSAASTSSRPASERTAATRRC